MMTDEQIRAALLSDPRCEMEEVLDGSQPDKSYQCTNNPLGQCADCMNWVCEHHCIICPNCYEIVCQGCEKDHGLVKEHGSREITIQ